MLAGILLAAALGAGFPQATVVDTLFGTPVPDPYRALERLDDPATVSWIAAQQGRTDSTLTGLPGHEGIRKRLEALWNYSRTEVPWREAGKVWYVENTGMLTQPVLYVQDTPESKPRVAFDPATLSPDGSIAVDDYSVSPDGRWLAYSASRGGADVGELRVRSLATGQDTSGVVRGAWGGATWTFDGGGYFYMRPPAPKPGEPADAPRVGKQLWYHAVGKPQSEDRFLREWADNFRWLYVMMSDDGRFAIVVLERGESQWIYAMNLGDPLHPNVQAPLFPVLGDRETGQTPLGTAGRVLFVITHVDAPRGKIVAVDLVPGAKAKVVVRESDAVIENAMIAGDRIVVQDLVDVKARLRLFTLAGKPAGAIRVPGAGAVGWPLNGRHSAPELWYAFTSYLGPSTVYRYDVRAAKSVPFHAPRVPFDGKPYETKQVFFRSKDGTRVPMFVTARRGLELDGSHPTLLTGYGGFGTTVAPAYRPDLPLWLEAGGVYAVANLRGGGEYGEEWHRAGSGSRKQNVFDDFAAAAENLIALGYTNPARLAIYGHSNGGLLVGAALTQRPELFAAAVPNAGHYDMLRFHRFTAGAGWIPEFGSPDSADAFRWLYAYSPLHHVTAGTCYPATLLLAADHDDRVVPSHAYKFAATLQAAQGCDRPILLRVAKNASHSYASQAEEIAEATDVWAFLASRLGVRLPW